MSFGSDLLVQLVPTSFLAVQPGNSWQDQSGLSTNLALFAAVEGVTSGTNDSTYVRISDVTQGGQAIAYRITDTLMPQGIFDNHKLRFRARVSAGTWPVIIGIALNADPRYVSPEFGLTTSFATYEIELPATTLSNLQAELLGLGQDHYNSINIFFRLPSSAGAPFRLIELSALEWEVPQSTLRVISRQSGEFLGRSTETRLTKQSVELLSDATDSEIFARTTEQSSEILSKYLIDRFVTKQTSEILASALALFLSKQSLELIAKINGSAVTRQTSEILGRVLGTRVSIQALEVLQEVQGLTSTRQTVEIVGRITGRRVSYQAVEFLGRLTSTFLSKQTLEVLAKFGGSNVTNQALELVGRVLGIRITIAPLEFLARNIVQRRTTRQVVEVLSSAERIGTTIQVLEVLAERPKIRLTLNALEVICSALVLRSTQQSVEFLGKTPRIDVVVTKESVELLHRTAPFRVSRQIVETIVQPVKERVSKQSLDVLAKIRVLRSTLQGTEFISDGTDLRIFTRTTGMLAEVIAKAIALHTTSQITEVLSKRGVEPRSVTQQSLEALGKVGRPLVTRQVVEVLDKLYILFRTSHQTAEVLGKALTLRLTSTNVEVLIDSTDLEVTSRVTRQSSEFISKVSPLRSSFQALEVLVYRIFVSIRLTQSSVEVLTDGTDRDITKRVTRQYLDVLGKVLRRIVTRQSLEVLVRRLSVPVNVTLQFNEVVGKLLKDQQVTKQSVEIIEKAPNTFRTTRQAGEFVSKVKVLRTSKQGLEVLVGVEPIPPDFMNLTKQAVEFLAGLSTDPVFCSNQRLEMISTAPIPKGMVSPLALPSPIPSLILANWQGELSIETAFSTDITRSATSTAEERWILRQSPIRILNQRLTGINRKVAIDIFQKISKLANSRTVFPLINDKVTADYFDADNNFFGIDSSEDNSYGALYRRIYRGQRIAVFNIIEREIVELEYHIVKTVGPQGISLEDAPLSIEYGLGTRLVPCIDVEISVNHSGAWLTDEDIDINLRAIEVSGPSSLPILQETTASMMYRGRPVFLLPSRYFWSSNVEFTILRRGKQFQSGRGVVTNISGERHLHSHTLSLILKGRPIWWRWQVFFEASYGSGSDFYFIAPYEPWEPIGFGSSFIDLERHGEVETIQDFFDHIAIIAKNNDTAIFSISTVIDTGTAFRVFVNEEIRSGLMVSQVRRVAPVFHSRFDTDAVRENWITTEDCEVDGVTIVEVLEEKEVQIPNLNVVQTLSPDDFANLYLWVESTRNLFSSALNQNPATPQRSIAASLGSNVSVWDDARQTFSDPFVLGANITTDRCTLARLTGSDKDTIWYTGGGPAFRGFSIVEGITNVIPGFHHSDDGLTVVWNGRLTDDDRQHRFLQRFGSIEWESRLVRIYETFSGSFNDGVYASPMIGNHLRTVILRWVRGKVEVWDSGNKVLDFVIPSNDIPADATLSLVSRLATGPTLQPDPDAGLGNDPMCNSIIIYARALSNTELNSLGAYLNLVFGPSWASI